VTDVGGSRLEAGTRDAAAPAFSAPLFALLLCLPLAAQEPSVTSSVDRTRVRIGENVVFTLTLRGPNLAIPQPSLPPLQGFRLVGQYQTIANTDEGKALSFHYLLSPTEAGRLVVPDLSIRVGGDAVTVTGFAVDVETGGRAPPPQTAPAQPARSDADIVLTGSISAPRCYAGEPVTYVLHLLTRRSVRGLDVVKVPDFSGFRKVEDPDSTKSPTRQVNHDGRSYLDAVVIRAVLFPLQAGRLTVGPYTAQLRLEPDGHGGPLQVTVTGGEASVEVLPLPAPPSGFRGAVGDFRLALQGAPPARVEAGQPFSLSFLIEGRGFLPENPLELPSTPFFSPFPPTSEDSSGFARGSYQTLRTIHLSLMPKLAGDAVIPPARMVFFDPAERSYKRLEAGGGKLLVTGAAAQPQSTPNLSPLIQVPRPGAPPSRPLSTRTFLLLLLGPLFVNMALAGGLWIHRTFFMAPEKRRQRALALRLRKSLNRGRRRLDVRRADAFNQDLSQAFTAALDLMTGRATGGLTRPQLEAALLESGLSPQKTEALLELSASLEAARYAPERPTRQDLQRRYDAVARWAKEASRG
jgi:hypothetical protein